MNYNNFYILYFCPINHNADTGQKKLLTKVKKTNNFFFSKLGKRWPLNIKLRQERHKNWLNSDSALRTLIEFSRLGQSIYRRCAQLLRIQLGCWLWRKAVWGWTHQKSRSVTNDITLFVILNQNPLCSTFPKECWISYECPLKKSFINHLAEF